MAPTRRQIIKLYATASAANLTHEDVIGQLRDAYGVESTKLLTALQYQEFCLFLEGKAGHRYVGDGPSPEEKAARYPAVWKSAQIHELVDQYWPACPPQIRPNLLLALDDFRLNRRGGRIARNIIVTEIQRLKRADLAGLAEALKRWFSGYRSHPGAERWFKGILRNVIRELANKRLAVCRAGAPSPAEYPDPHTINLIRVVEQLAIWSKDNYRPPCFDDYLRVARAGGMSIKHKPSEFLAELRCKQETAV